MSNNVRSSNLELYRIIVMLLIVAHHYVVNSGLMDVMAEEPLSGRSVFFYLFGVWGKTGINCFLMITGYFMCMSQITVRKFLKLLFEVEFYKIIIYAIFVLSGYETFSVSGCIKSIVPMLSLTDGFVSCFLVFYLCIPFLNILVHNMDRRMHGLLVLLCLFIYTVHGTLPGMSVSMNYVSWFCVLYFIASYIRLYAINMLSNVKWGGYAGLCILVSSMSIVFALWISARTGRHIYQYRLVSDSNALMAVATAVTSFMFFKNLKIPYNKYINIIGASTFGVLLIHANSDTMRRWLWRDVVDCVGHYSDDLYWLRPIIAVLLIFTICIVIDYIRIKTVEKWTFKWIDRFLPNDFDKPKDQRELTHFGLARNRTFKNK